MKKISLLTILFFSVAFLYAQVDVVVTIDVNNNPDVTDVMFRGVPSEWMNIQGYDDGTNGDATSGDGIWSATFVGVNCDDESSEWGAVDQNDGWLMNALTSNLAFVVDAACATTGEVSYVYPVIGADVNVTLSVDMNNMITRYGMPTLVSVAGAFQDWTPGNTVMEDVDADGIYEAVVVMEGNSTQPYKFLFGGDWGYEEGIPGDCSAGGNRELTIGAGDMAAPTVCFGTCGASCPDLGDPVAVTFICDLSNEIPSNEGVHLTGTIQFPSWVKDDLVMEALGAGEYGKTLSLYPGSYEYKFVNGDGDAEPGVIEEENAEFLDLGCGIDNPVSTPNRVLIISSTTPDTIVGHQFNSCALATSVGTNDVFSDKVQLNIQPNPATGQTVVQFENEKNEAFDLVITNITGQTVRTINNVRTNRVEISLNEMAAGMYFATLRNQEGASATRKLIVR